MRSLWRALRRTDFVLLLHSSYTCLFDMSSRESARCPRLAERVGGGRNDRRFGAGPPARRALSLSLPATPADWCISELTFLFPPADVFHGYLESKPTQKPSW